MGEQSAHQNHSTYSTYVLYGTCRLTSFSLSLRQCEPPSTLAVLGAGGIGGILSWIFTYPIDVIKSRLQADQLDNGRYRGGIDCLKKTVQSEGIQCLGRGIGSAIIRLILQ